MDKDRQASIAAGRQGRTISLQASPGARSTLPCELIIAAIIRRTRARLEMPGAKGSEGLAGADDIRPRQVDGLYRDLAPVLRRRLRARLGSSDEANDLVHDAFARLIGAQSSRSLKEPGAFLNRIVRNLLIDRARRQAVRPPIVALGTDVDVPVAPDQGQNLELEQMRRRYRDIVNQLPPRTREVFLLHRLEGVAYREIAERLDISVRTVEWHVAQAIVRISKGLDGE